MSKTIAGNEMKLFTTKPVLKEAKLYQNHNSLQKRDAHDALEEYKSKMKWKDEANVLDVGCGDGGVTVHVLKPFLPENFKRLIGCDIAPEMIIHANMHHDSERVKFVVSDVSGSGMLLGQFDHIFSFYALHWVQEQEKALRNIHASLTTGGDCLLVFLCYIPIYDIYRIMAQRPVWKEYMQDLESFISPYCDSEDPEEEFSRLLKKCGFTHVEVERKNKTYCYEGIDNLKKAVRAVNPFNHRLSPTLQEQFLDEYMEIVRNKNFVKEETECEEKRTTIQTNYSLLIAYAVK